MSQTAKQQLSDHVRFSVLSMHWAPGQDLDESTLSVQFGVSRTPLREVFRDLAAQGFLELRAHRTARVAELGHQTLREFFQAAPMIYAAISRLAAENRHADQLAQLSECQQRFQLALAGSDPIARALANHDFHRQIAVMANNRYLLPSFDRLAIDHTRIGKTFYRADADRESPQIACQQHDDMIQAITAQQGERAGQLAIDHWNLSKHQFAQFVMPEGLSDSLGLGDNA